MSRRGSVLVLCCLPAIAATIQEAPSSGVVAGIAPTDQQIQTAQRRVRAVPGDYAGYDSLGTAYLQKARETADISNFDLAEKALLRSVELAPQDFRLADPLVHLAMVYMGEHRFADALSGTQKAIALGSGNLAAFAIEGDAYTDLGQYDDAQAAYQAARSLGSTFASPLTIAYMLDSRMAYLSFLHGDAKTAIGLMKSAIAAGTRTRAPGENIAWLYYELGERYFQTGDLANAASSYSTAISIDPTHYRSLAGLAKVRAAEGKWAEAIQLYERSINIVPFPQYVAELGDAYAQSGHPVQAKQQYDLVEYIGHLSALNQVLANRELALFYADHGMKLSQALQLARNELNLRHDVYTWDTLAWVLYKNGRLPEATEAAKTSLGLHTPDSLMLFHAGKIAHAAGNDSVARNDLTEALKLNPNFHVKYAAEASRTLAGLRQTSAKTEDFMKVDR